MCEFAYNSRLDTIQAVVAKYLIEKKLSNITDSRIKNAMRLDSMLEKVPQISLLKRDKDLKEVFHLYVFKAENRDELYEHLRKYGIDAKVHYPVPMHLQPASNYLGHAEGDFPVAESFAKNTISLPVHEFISTKHILMLVEYIIRNRKILKKKLRCNKETFLQLEIKRSS